MQRKCAKKNAYNAGTTSASQDLIYQHMSNHYRRILNAKKVVDTSPPYCFKKKRPHSGHVVPALPTARSIRTKHASRGGGISPAATDRTVSTNSYNCGSLGPYPSSRYHAACVEDLPNFNPVKKYAADKHLIRNIACSYRDNNWADIKGKDKNKKSNPCSAIKKCICNETDSRHSKRRFEARDTKPAQQEDDHPVQVKNKSSPELPIECSSESPNCKCRKICLCEAGSGCDVRKDTGFQSKEQVQTSSRDSAYNGGVSSLPESRSPTPDRRLKNDFYESNENCYSTCGSGKSGDILKSPVEDGLLPVSRRSDKIREEKIAESSPLKLQSSRLWSTKATNENTLSKMKEDDLYTRFIEDITVEMLEKCLYTNKALKKVMKKHIANNIQTLNKARMLKEVDNLRIRLGIPEDSSLFDLNVSSTSSYGDIISACPVISDSEFVMPDEISNSEEGNETKPQNGWFGVKHRPSVFSKIRKSTDASMTSTSENEEEIVSVIQVKKQIREIENSESPTLKSLGSDGLEHGRYSSYDSDMSYDSENSKSEEEKEKSERREKKTSISTSREKNDRSKKSESSSEIEEDISEGSSSNADGKSTDSKQHSAADKSKAVNETSVMAILHKKSRSVSFRNNKECSLK